jgi:hypothetical protein
MITQADEISDHQVGNFLFCFGGTMGCEFQGTA